MHTNIESYESLLQKVRETKLKEIEKWEKAMHEQVFDYKSISLAEKEGYCSGRIDGLDYVETLLIETIEQIKEADNK